LMGMLCGSAVGLVAGKSREKGALGPLPPHVYAAHPDTLRRDFLH